jgi:oligopeptide/dipeptide ABC transporter ATP-binding protein
MNALLELRDVVKHFPVRDALGRRAGAVHAVDGVSLSVAEGEVLAIVGESGCGKSTLGRVMLRLIEPDSGSVRFAGEDLAALSPAALRARRREMQIIFQDPFGSLDPRMTVAQAIAEPLRLHRLVPRGQEAARVAELLTRVGLRPESAGRWPHEFSGGQRQRICIARALAVEPRLIVADESVSALDVSIKAQVINLMLELQAGMGLAYLFISHDLAVVREISHRVMVLYLGRVVEQAPADRIFEDARHPYTRALLSAALIPDPAVERRRPRVRLTGELPSPLDPEGALRFLPSRRGQTPVYRPRLEAVAPGHWVSEFDPPA